MCQGFRLVCVMVKDCTRLCTVNEFVKLLSASFVSGASGTPLSNLQNNLKWKIRSEPVKLQ